MITDDEKEAVRRTWRLVVPIAGTAADLFYKRLFELRPEYAELFQGDLTVQKRKLLQMLAFIVKSLDWPESAWKDPVSAEQDLMMVLLALGRRHQDLYRVPAESYAVVGEALIWTLDYGLGNAFDDTARGAWLRIYQLVSATMRMGSALTNGQAAHGDRPRSEGLGKSALEDYQRKYGHSEIDTTPSNGRGGSA
ncbi:MAG TPA: globin domain-containing protein [Polyangiales bacterium]|nr:globin domain-containing protein [Polyangiales bacterium]